VKSLEKRVEALANAAWFLAKPKRAKSMLNYVNSLKSLPKAAVNTGTTEEIAEEPPGNELPSQLPVVISLRHSFYHCLSSAMRECISFMN